MGGHETTLGNDGKVHILLAVHIEVHTAAVQVVTHVVHQQQVVPLLCVMHQQGGVRRATVKTFRCNNSFPSSGKGSGTSLRVTTHRHFHSMYCSTSTFLLTSNRSFLPITRNGQTLPILLLEINIVHCGIQLTDLLSLLRSVLPGKPVLKNGLLWTRHYVGCPTHTISPALPVG